MRWGIVLALAIFLQTSYAAKEIVGKGGNRLPKSITPDHYKLKILTHIEDEKPFQFFGDVSIKVGKSFFLLLYYFHL